MATQKIGQLEAAARDLVGDCGNPNLFFVTVDGAVVTITNSGTLAYEQWKAYEIGNRICALEDRQVGTLCQRDLNEETGKIVVTDDFNLYWK